MSRLVASKLILASRCKSTDSTGFRNVAITRRLGIFKIHDVCDVPLTCDLRRKGEVLRFIFAFEVCHAKIVDATTCTSSQSLVLNVPK